MDITLFDAIRKRPYVLPVLILVSTAAALVLNWYGLIYGITYVLPHLLYIPIILCAYYYPRRGIVFASVLSVIYCVLVFFMTPASFDVIVSACARCIVFVGISAVISYISGHVHDDLHVCLRLVSVVESSRDAIVGTSLHGIITDWNKSAEGLYGYSAQEAIGKPVTLIVPMDKSAEITTLLDKIRTGEPIERYETERVTKDGRRLQISLSLSPIKNHYGEIIGASYISHDITDQKRLLDAVQNAKDDWERTFDAVPDMIALIDRNYRILRANRSMAERVGLSPEAMIGKACFETVHKTHGPLKACPHTLLIRDGESHMQEIHDDALGGDFQVTVSPFMGVSGEVMGSVHVIHDITERKRAEEALHENETLLREAQKVAHIGSWTLDPKTGLENWSDELLRIYGFEPRDVVPSFSEHESMIHPDDWSKLNATIHKSLATGQDYEIEVRLTRKDGQVRTMLSRGHIQRGKNHEIIRLIGTSQDITERKITENALRLANNKLTMLSSITRHDILNKLTGLRMYLELSKESVKDPVFLEYITKEIDAAGAIERQIEFTRFYESIGVNAPQWQDVAERIRSAASQLPLEEITFDILLPPVQVYADALIEKVFYNLIENSLRHGGGVTCISFSFEETQSGAVITYRDDGIGISLADKDKLFRRGFGKHTGLGLFLSREILSITGITITENGEQGKGVCFEIHVPKVSYRVTLT